MFAIYHRESFYVTEKTCLDSCDICRNIFVIYVNDILCKTLPEWFLDLERFTCQTCFGRYVSKDWYRDGSTYFHSAPNMGLYLNERMWKVRPIMSKALENIQMIFRPFQNVMTNEFLLTIRVLLNFPKYIVLASNSDMRKHDGVCCVEIYPSLSFHECLVE